MSAPTVLGVDLSLTSTGLATATWTSTNKPTTTGLERLRRLRDDIVGLATYGEHALVVVEGPSYGSAGQGQHERGGLWWIVTEAIDDHGVPVAVVPPANLKQYATGKGNAGKDAVLLATARAFPWFQGGNDEADALWLCAMGHDHLGSPLVERPAKNRKALDGCSWPGAT